MKHLFLLLCLEAESAVTVKKRGRRNKSREHRESELEFMAETFLQQLHNLPSVALVEPTITLSYCIVPFKGAASMTGEPLSPERSFESFSVMFLF